jgi:hypothetical protein
MRREGFKMLEVPVYWIERRHKRTKFTQLFDDIGVFGPSLARIYYNTKLSKK